MKKLFTLGLALLAGATAAQAQLIPVNGGPDAYGYTYKTSAAPGGPTYSWVDITSRGTLVTGLGDDNVAPGSVALPFTFSHYLSTFTSFRIGSNGYITFANSTNLSQPFPTIPTVDRGGAANTAFIAGYMADLKFDADANAPGVPNPARCYYYVNADSAVISYINVPFWENATPDFRGSNTFQIILTRADGNITVQYQDMDPVQPTPGANSPNQVIVGVEDQTQTMGLQAGINQIPTNLSAVRFIRPASTTLQFLDVGPNYFNADGNGANFFLLNQPMNPTVNIGSFGNLPAGTFPASVFIQNRPGFSNQRLYNQTVTLPSLRVGTDTVMTFPTYTPTTAAPSTGTGVFRVQMQTNLTGDQNAGNNIMRTMFVVVDTAASAQTTLSYDDEAPADPVGFGAGVYFKPPFYPAELVGTEAGVLGANATSNTSITVRVLADDGPNGSAGTQLFTQSIAANDVTVGATNSLNFPAIRINSGGFYITWVPDVIDSTFIAAHGPASATATVPVANRSYEVIGGVLAPYRSTDQNINITAVINSKPPPPTGVSHDYTNQASFRSVFPNPATERATVNYSLKQSQVVSLTVTDLLGRPVRTMALGQPTAGQHQFELPVNDLPAGLYICALRVGSTTLTQKMVVQH